MISSRISAAVDAFAGCLGLALLVALVAPLAATAADAAARELPFATAVAAYEVAPRERVFDGTVEAVNRATVSAQTSGRVAELPYDVNDFVEAGSVIVRLTDTEQRAALKRAEAALAEAGARAAEANKEFERVSGMYRNETVPKARFDQAKANKDAADARLQAARSGVAAAKEQLDYTVVKAPYSGIVSARHVQVGELVNPGQPLMSGISLESLRVSVSVPQSLIEPVRKIGKAFVYVDSKRIEGKSLTFFPVADPVSNTFQVRVNLPDRAATLYPGMFVKVGLVVGETRRLLIPNAAVVARSELTAAYVVEGDKVVLRQLRLGRHYGDRIEVLAGLDAGERVALDPVAAGVYEKGQSKAAGSKDGE